METDGERRIYCQKRQMSEIEEGERKRCVWEENDYRGRKGGKR